MPVLAGWLTGEQVPQEVIDQTLVTMGDVLALHGGQPARTTQPGAGLIAFSEPAHAMQRNDDPPVLDWVSDRRTLVYHRPLSGLHPLYYVEDWPAQGNLLFASEIKALLAVGVPRRLHLAALNALLRYGFIPAPWTAFKDIHVVPAGSILRWQRAKTILNHASDYHLDDLLPSQPQNDALDHLHTLLDDSIAAMLPPHEQLVALTGGAASSALPALLSSHHSTASFCIASIGYKKSSSASVWRDAERIAEACQRPFLAVTGVDQPEFWTATLTALEAPTVDTRPLTLHQLLHTVAVETEARVAISGLGARTLLSSLTHTSTSQTVTSSEPQDILSQYTRSLSTPSHSSAARIWSPDVIQALQDAERWEETLHARKLARQAARFSGQQLAHYYLDLHLRLPDLVVNPAQQLAIQDRMAIRSPYLNPHIIDTLTRLPSSLDDGTPKAALPSQLARRYMPDELETRSILPLRGPIASLLRLADSELLQQTLSQEAIRATGIFDPLAVNELLTRKVSEASRRKLLLVFTTQLLYRLFGVGI